ncbi:MAG: amidase [Chloroflexi bacterium]|nr:MAG: amidase [Chloroflexota bacterium]
MTFEREVCYLTAAELSEGYRRKRFTALEVTEALLRRIERLDGGLRAYITVTADHARAQAKAADAALAQSDPRPLLGVPLALKDLFATKGIRTTAGSKVFWDRVPTEDATCVARLRSAGTVLLGKLTMHELAYGWPTEEGQLATGRNPWDTTRIPAGSSSGCGVAVAAGLATITLGSDTGGSIRGPANNCGIVGLKPTYGRVSVRGAAPLSWSLDHMGPLCRTVEDVALTLAAIAGVDRRDPTSSTRRVPDYRAVLEADVKGVRVGVPGESLYREHALDGEIRSALEAAAGVLRGSGAIVRRVEMPKPARWQAIVNVILSEAYEYHAERLRSEPEKFSVGLRQLLYALAPYTASDYIRAQRLRRVIAEEMRELFRAIDVILMPVEFYLPITFAESHAELAAGARPPSLRSIWNLVGYPSLAMPCGSSRGGLPIGMQLVGRAFDEPLLLRVGAAYERSTDWHARHPPLDDG